MRKKTKVVERPLDVITREIGLALRSETVCIIKSGTLLLEAKAQIQHGQWLPWLQDNFDLSLRTAQNYMAVAGFSAKNAAMLRNSKLTPTALYWLVTAELPAKVVAKILRRARHHRVTEADVVAAAEVVNAAIRTKQVAEWEAEEAAERAAEEAQASDAEAILDGPPPELAPQEPEPSQPLPPMLAGADDLLSDFHQAVSILKQASTKPANRFRNIGLLT